MSGVVQRVANAGKQIASNPQVKGMVEQVTGATNSATGFVSQRYADLMQKNSKFIIGNSPSFYVTKENVRMHALFTTLAEYAHVPSGPWVCHEHAMCRAARVKYHYRPTTVACSIPRISKACARESVQWRQAIQRALQSPKDAVAGDVGCAMLFTAELLALFKVGEFFGRGCTLFGYWP